MSLNYIIPFVAYFLIASPAAYKIVRNAVGSWVANAEGLPTTAGLALHGLVFIAIVGFIMKITFKRVSTFGGAKQAGEYCDGGGECYHTCYGGRCN